MSDSSSDVEEFLKNLEINKDYEKPKTLNIIDDDIWTKGDKINTITDWKYLTSTQIKGTGELRQENRTNEPATETKSLNEINNENWFITKEFKTNKDNLTKDYSLNTSDSITNNNLRNYDQMNLSVFNMDENDPRWKTRRYKGIRVQSGKSRIGEFSSKKGTTSIINSNNTLNQSKKTWKPIKKTKSYLEQYKYNNDINDINEVEKHKTNPYVNNNIKPNDKIKANSEINETPLLTMNSRENTNNKKNNNPKQEISLQSTVKHESPIIGINPGVNNVDIFPSQNISNWNIYNNIMNNAVGTTECDSNKANQLYPIQNPQNVQMMNYPNSNIPFPMPTQMQIPMSNQYQPPFQNMNCYPLYYPYSLYPQHIINFQGVYNQQQFVYPQDYNCYTNISAIDSDGDKNKNKVKNKKTKVGVKPKDNTSNIKHIKEKVKDIPTNEDMNQNKKVQIIAKENRLENTDISEIEISNTSNFESSDHIHNNNKNINNNKDDEGENCNQKTYNKIYQLKQIQKNQKWNVQNKRKDKGKLDNTTKDKDDWLTGKHSKIYTTMKQQAVANKKKRPPSVSVTKVDVQKTVTKNTDGGENNTELENLEALLEKHKSLSEQVNSIRTDFMEEQPKQEKGQ